ncbi:hypothetical protein BDV12DRAFT_195197 [Aspergillus spectabilis]
MPSDTSSACIARFILMLMSVLRQIQQVPLPSSIRRPVKATCTVQLRQKATHLVLNPPANGIVAQLRDNSPDLGTRSAKCIFDLRLAERLIRVLSTYIPMDHRRTDNQIPKENISATLRILRSTTATAVGVYGLLLYLKGN